MKVAFLGLPESERRLYIEEAAARRSVSAVIIEKDFWVSWMLAVLFRSEFAGNLVFKGGTSLSKVFGAIDRFSEDIDLSLASAFVGIDAPGEDSSRTKLDRWMHDAQEACAVTLRRKVKPLLDREITWARGGRRTLPPRALAYPDDPKVLARRRSGTAPVRGAGGGAPSADGEWSAPGCRRATAGRPPSRMATDAQAGVERT